MEKKKKKLSSLEKKGPIQKIAVVVCIALVVIIFLSLRSAHRLVSVELPVAPTVRSVDPTIRIILGKTSPNPVPSRFSPVLIYRMTKESQITGQFAGSGSLFTASNGRQIITTEHLFPKASGEQMYVYQLLRSGNNLVYGIEKILNTGREISGGTADAIILKIADSKPILGFSVHSPDELENIKTKIRLVTGTYLRSLVTGEEVSIIGFPTSPLQTKVGYTLIDYSSIDGESGSGFVDKDDNIYVLKGRPINYSLEDSPLRKFKALSFVYGPLKFRK